MKISLSGQSDLQLPTDVTNKDFSNLTGRGTADWRFESGFLQTL
jgi:hypothetical protein